MDVLLLLCLVLGLLFSGRLVARGTGPTPNDPAKRQEEMHRGNSDLFWMFVFGGGALAILLTMGG